MYCWPPWQESVLATEQERQRRPEFMKCSQRSVSARKKLSMGGKAKPWTGRSGTKAVGISPGTWGDRYRDVIDICWEKAKVHASSLPGKLTVPALADKVVVDISQSCDRFPVTIGKLKTFTTRTLLFSLRDDSVWWAGHHLRLMGWGRQFVDGRFSDGELRSLAGDSFSVPIVTLIGMGCYLCPFADWWQ